MFVIVATTQDPGFNRSVEGDLEWIDPTTIDSLTTFEDLKLIINTIKTLKENEMFVGTSRFDGKFKLLDINLSTI